MLVWLDVMRGNKASVQCARGMIRTDRTSEMDRETFDVMWELSAPGSPAEGCFLRLKQEEYYGEEKVQPDPLEFMPDVSRSIRRLNIPFTRCHYHRSSSRWYHKTRSFMKRPCTGFLFELLRSMSRYT